MRVENLVALMLITPFCSCLNQDASASFTTLSKNDRNVRLSSLKAQERLLEFDLVQRTCAMYVAVHSRAIEESISFGRDLNDVDIHWNMCPSGNMVACATVPTASGDSTQVGIPWPY